MLMGFDGVRWGCLACLQVRYVSRADALAAVTGQAPGLWGGTKQCFSWAYI